MEESGGWGGGASNDICCHCDAPIQIPTRGGVEAEAVSVIRSDSSAASQVSCAAAELARGQCAAV